MRWRVVCGLSETIATFWPTNRLSSVDLPAFGRPTSETNPAFTRRLLGAPARLPPDADLVDAPALGLEDLDVEAVEREALADRRHAADARQHVAADGLELAVLDLDAEPLDHLARSPTFALNTNVSSASRTIGSASLSYSSRISPTSSSTTSSTVTRPAVPPYSSTTIASWKRFCWNSRSRSTTRLVSGTNAAGRMISRDRAACPPARPVI